jgi:protein transport protein SEC24
MRLIKASSPLTLSHLLYPRIIALHTLAPTAGFPDPATGHLVVPAALRASFSRIDDGGAYLVDDGQTCLLWLHAQTSPNLLEDLFGPGTTTLAAISPDLAALPVLATHLNAQARNILAYWAALRGSRALTLQIARQGLDGAEFEFARLLVEDRNGEAQSYVDWLVLIHRGIQLELAGQRKREVAAEMPESAGLVGLRAMGW